MHFFSSTITDRSPSVPTYLTFLQIVGTVGLHGTSISSALLISAASLFYPVPLAGRKALQLAAQCAKPKSRHPAAALRVDVCTKKSANVHTPGPESLKTLHDEQVSGASSCPASSAEKKCVYRKRL